jgi:hypothetical protein
LEDLSIPIFEELQHRETGLSAVFAWWGPGIMNVEAGGELSRSLVWAITGNCYSQLGVQPLLGRFLDDADVRLHQGGPEPVAVIGYQFWQRYYGGDPAVIGERLLVEGSPFTVVGVARQEFTGLAIASDPDVTIGLTAKPLITGESPEKLYSSAGAWLGLGGRVRTGGRSIKPDRNWSPFGRLYLIEPRRRSTAPTSVPVPGEPGPGKLARARRRADAQKAIHRSVARVACDFSSDPADCLP